MKEINNIAAFGHFPLGFKDVVDIHRKNMQTFAALQGVVLQNMQAIVRQHSEIMSKMVSDNSSIARELISEQTPEDKVAAQAGMAKKAYEASVSSWKEMASLVEKANREASTLINGRITDSLSELKNALDKSENPASRKAA